MTAAARSDPFFVVGTGRSGTTMFRNLLRQAPGVFIPRETHWLPILWNEFGTRSVPTARVQDMVDRVYMAKGRTAFERIALEAKRSTDDLRAAVSSRVGTRTTVAAYHRGLLAEVGAATNADRPGDKTPDYGFAMERILGHFPDARFIHVVRDGRDVALSMSKVLSFRILAGLELTHWWAVALDRGYERGLAAAEAEIPIDRFLELWHRRVMRIRDEASRLPGDRLLEVPYESLLGDPRGTLARVDSFLGWDDAARWVETSAALVRRENLARNLDDPMRSRLGTDHADLLEDAGFTA